MDKFDRRITELLRSNARASVSEIARAVSLSRTAVTARIQKLEKEKIILGYHADVAVEEKTEQIKAYMALKFDMSRATQYCEIYADLIYKIDGVKWCHAISGETDMMLYVEVDTMTQLNTIRDELQQIPELRHLMTHTVLTEFFNTFEHA